ncbi:MAG: SMC-Scp complex subunit ScpB [Nanoarchaeota archaeon]|nr:SMC-Scp complex subunit ScpB [Nanoarchaeota archaeon]
MPKNEVEALLFSAGKNMSVENIANIIGKDKREILEELSQLKKEYNERDGALMIIDEGEQWKIHVREQYLSLVRKIVADTELPKTVLETLAIIAYRSPILQSEVVEARSSVAYEHIPLLMDMGFVTKEKKGRSFQLKITEKFFEYFDVEGDKDLKTLFKEVKKPVKIDDKQEEELSELGEALYNLKHHKPHGEIVDIPTQKTADPDKQAEESLSNKTDENVHDEFPKGPYHEEEKTVEEPKEKQATEDNDDNDSDVKKVLDSVEQEIDEIVEHKEKFAKSVEKEIIEEEPEEEPEKTEEIKEEEINEEAGKEKGKKDANS